ncbi:MAG: hypothetical protein JOZ32_21625 [Bryobacterales bacterium]|nr:hypothetical protein [Bryobacterales bacterium]
MTAHWKDPITLFELVSAGAIALGAFVWPSAWSPALRVAESRIYRLAAHCWISILSVGILSFTGSAGVALLTRLPQPYINDEFAHLLAADTFASGRLNNPTHPMWIHFESFHINQKPTYVSKYPPAQGLILALGQIVSGLPIVGVWLSSALACAAICWMLQAWFRPGVALVGALLAVFQIGILSYWTQSYWGGMMAALGSALAFGGMRRIVRGSELRTSELRSYSLSATVALGTGLAILANSRPFEGLLATLPICIVLGFSYSHQSASERSAMLRQVVAPLLRIGLATLLAMGYYNFRQTGNPLITAYQVNTNTYQVQPIFSWERFREAPVYHHAVMREYYMARGLSGAQLENLIRTSAPTVVHRVLNLWQFYPGALLTLPFLLGAMSESPLILAPLATVVTVCAGLILNSLWLSPHYAAPMTGPFFIVVTHGWRRLRAYKFRHRRSGLFLARGIVALCMVMLCIRVFAAHFQLNTAIPEWPYRRAAIQRQLEQAGGYHLIIVRYGNNHPSSDEWVYNRADIDRARVVWAREMDREHNRDLIAYFHTRSVWLLQADDSPQKLVPYPALPPATQSGLAAAH